MILNQSISSQPYSFRHPNYSDVIIGVMASQITSVSIVYSTVCSGVDQRKHQSSTSLVIVRGIQRWPVNSPHKGPVTQKIFPFDDVIMWCQSHLSVYTCRVMPQSHHTPGPRKVCSRAVLNKNRATTHRVRTGPMRHRTNFASLYGACRVLMHAL